MIARSLAAAFALCAASSLAAQAPSWNAQGQGSLSKQPSSAVSNRVSTGPAAIAAAGAPPRDRDCKTQITRPDATYAVPMTHWYTDGTEDHGQVLNSVNTTTHMLQVDLDDMQVRVEQLRCEQQNVKAKLDFIIHVLVP